MGQGLDSVADETLYSPSGRDAYLDSRRPAARLFVREAARALNLPPTPIICCTTHAEVAKRKWTSRYGHWSAHIKDSSKRDRSPNSWASNPGRHARRSDSSPTVSVVSSRPAPIWPPAQHAVARTSMTVPISGSRLFSPSSSPNSSSQRRGCCPCEAAWALNLPNTHHLRHALRRGCEAKVELDAMEPWSAKGMTQTGPYLVGGWLANAMPGFDRMALKSRGLADGVTAGGQGGGNSSSDKHIEKKIVRKIGSLPEIDHGWASIPA
ncbi:hypothetical protein BDK51DRAFT_31518 [Blyttiomyces helicus]|uniref:Uncharacterized protein n=1 Tax=Blyttiomyces helicus TaxID=388810 RepID=A0A4P9VUJ3_9FUNG|nr:hypothetical protein BDK51DRAFT_31518 [Blyttiomyces helicus]|eukprot:RKO82762.1 hypothetical protein BDK51DRAFT_31518 [Blyttiomyces helicus]